MIFVKNTINPKFHDMKKLILALFISLIAAIIYAQAPASFSYQAVARDADGAILPEKALTIRIGILMNEELIYQEDHSLTTDRFGGFLVIVGGDDAENISGQVQGVGDIPWGDGSFSMNLRVDAGNGFVNMGTSLLHSVPYAIFASNSPAGDDADPANELNEQFYLSGNILYLRDAGGLKSADLSSIAGGGTNLWQVNEYGVFIEDPKLNMGIGTSTPMAKFTVQGDETITDEMPLFEVRNFRDEVVFSGYNNGVFVNVENNPKSKGLKGGFAVGGYNRTKAEPVQEYMRVTNDSTRIYVNDAIQGKGLKGGFAVGGYNTSKAGYVEHLSVQLGVTRINGDLELAGTVIDISDEKFKQNVVSIDDAVALVMQLEGVRYDWNENALQKFSLEDTKQIGFVAQDVEAVFPELVKKSSEGYLMVDYAKITPVLVQAIKEQQRKIQKLEEENKKMAELEKRLEALEKLLNE